MDFCGMQEPEICGESPKLPSKPPSLTSLARDPLKVSLHKSVRVPNSRWFGLQMQVSWGGGGA